MAVNLQAADDMFAYLAEQVHRLGDGIGDEKDSEERSHAQYNLQGSRADSQFARQTTDVSRHAAHAP